ncbi:hypothetical protein ACN38_g5170 [Penicillium nordicum]|uniref:Uncharacterized protein n=1 Tax=Penicillium nordicum TaxID=229535 RepID=A0A0M9WGF2_9EURO|nr:hypothetical protein ACN38_g5170 [Penicillium nordicum]
MHWSFPLVSQLAEYRPTSPTGAKRGPCTLTLLQPVFPVFFLFSFFLFSFYIFYIFDLTNIILYHSSPEHQNQSQKKCPPHHSLTFPLPLTLCSPLNFPYQLLSRPRGPKIGPDLWIDPSKTGLSQIFLACGR